MTLPMSSFLKALVQSSFFATWPFGTFVKICSICSTSERSFSTPERNSLTLFL